MPVTSLTLKKPQAFAKHHQKQVYLSLWGECGNAVFASSWRDSMSEDVRVRFDTGALHGRLCFKKQISPLWFLRVLTPTGPRTVSGLRETLAFELLPCHFLLLKQKQREDKRVLTTHSCIRHEITSIRPSIHPSCENGRVRTRQSGNKAGFVS